MVAVSIVAVVAVDGVPVAVEQPGYLFALCSHHDAIVACLQHLCLAVVVLDSRNRVGRLVLDDPDDRFYCAVCSDRAYVWMASVPFGSAASIFDAIYDHPNAFASVGDEPTTISDDALRWSAAALRKYHPLDPIDS